MKFKEKKEKSFSIQGYICYFREILFKYALSIVVPLY